jgi:hypothetical protein
VFEQIDLWDLTDKRIRVKFQQHVIGKFLDYCVDLIGKKTTLSKLVNKPNLLRHFNDYKFNRSSISLDMVKSLVKILPYNEKENFKTELRNNLLEIKLGGSLSKPIRNPKFPITLSKDFLEFLGHLLGDGCIEFISNCPIIWYTNKSDELINRFSEIVKNIFGDVDLYKRVQKNGVKDIRCPTIVGIILNELLKSSLNSLDFIKKLDNEQKIVFLRALFDDEGCVSIKKYQIIIEMANKTLIEYIKSLLLELGIRSGKISKVVEIDYKNRYRISISGKENLELFYRKINFINRDKRNKLYILLNSYKIK